MVVCAGLLLLNANDHNQTFEHMAKKFIKLSEVIELKTIAGNTDNTTTRPYQVCRPDKRIATQLFFLINQQ